MGLRTKVTIISTALAIAGVTSVEAFVPEYDIERYCERIASFGSYSADVRNYCIRQERKAYNNLVNDWGWYESLRGLAYCEKLADHYELLQYCLRQELRAERR